MRKKPVENKAKADRSKRFVVYNIVGDVRGNGVGMYDCLEFYLGPDDNSFETHKRVISSTNLLQLMSNGQIKLDNIIIGKEGNIVGINNSSMDRFHRDEKNQFVVLAELVNDKGDVLGYKVVDRNCKIKAVKKKDLIEHCNNERDKGIEYPIQNMIFQQKDGGVLRRFTEDQDILKIIIAKTTPVQSNIKKDAKTRFTEEQIQILKEAKEEGIDIKMIANPKIQADVMRFYIAELRHGVDIRPILSTKFNAEQIFQISLGYHHGVSYKYYADPKLSAVEMAEHRLRLEMKIWKEYR